MGTAVQDVITSHLSRILASPQFVRAGRLSEFLRFIVEETAAGRGDSLKETVIGTAVFGRPPGYNPKSDSTVRIHASRLREKLRDYYLASGKDDRLIIELPKGAYVPLILTAQKPALGRRVRPWAVGIVLAILVLACALALAWRWRASSIKSIAVIPLHNLGSDPDSEMIADGLTEDLIRQLVV